MSAFEGRPFIEPVRKVRFHPKAAMPAANDDAPESGFRPIQEIV
jgi:hypothetical protein